jgi:hypothetical protein
MSATKIDETTKVEWTRYQGDSLTIDIAEVDSNGASVDYTGATPRLAVGTITETTSGVVVTNGLTAGTLSFFIPDTVMATLAVSDYDIAVEVYYASTATRRTLFTGTLSLIEDVRV